MQATVQPAVWTVAGSALYGEYHAPPARDEALGRILMLHGFNSGLREFGTAPADIAAAGFHVLAFDQRGFGASGGERGRTGLERALEDVRGAVEWLDSHGTEGPLAAVGHSLGGSYALGIQARTDLFRCIVVAHAVDRLLDPLSRVEKGAYHAIGRLHRRRLRKGKPAWTLPYKIRYETIFEDKAAAAQGRRDDFLHPSVNMANYDFAATMQARDWARRVTVPVLCIQSDRDKVMPRPFSEGVYEAIAGPTERFEHRGGHSAFRDLDAGPVADATIRFLQEHAR